MARNAFRAALRGLGRRLFEHPGDDVIGGERGIRTPDTLAGTPDFESGAFSRSASSPETDASYPKHQNRKRKSAPPVRNAWQTLAERVGFEPTIRFRIHAFQACAFGRSATSPTFFAGGRTRSGALRILPRAPRSQPRPGGSAWGRAGGRTAYRPRRPSDTRPHRPADPRGH